MFAHSKTATHIFYSVTSFFSCPGQRNHQACDESNKEQSTEKTKLEEEGKEEEEEVTSEPGVWQ